MLKKSAVYKRVHGKFPIGCPHATFIEVVPNGFLRFKYKGKEILMNGGEYEEIKEISVDKIVACLLLCLLCGCAFLRETTVKAGAGGAKAKAYGEFEDGEVVYKSRTVIKVLCK